jgi:hypothetical protein
VGVGGGGVAAVECASQGKSATFGSNMMVNVSYL